MGETDGRAAFTTFFRSAEPKLRRALASVYGPEVGRDSAAEALVWGWQNWSRLSGMENPIGYLYRVGRTNANRSVAKPSVPLGHHEPPPSHLPESDPHVRVALGELSERQRTAVVLVHGYGYRHREVAELLECSASTVANHVERGLGKLRAHLGATDHV
jgi:RNA polymerase sigma-70 factor (ECF subfamily)